MFSSPLTIQAFNCQDSIDTEALDKLWMEYNEYFSLQEDQPEYYQGSFSSELKSLKSVKNKEKNLYFFRNNSDPLVTIGMSMLCPTSDVNVCEIKKVLISKDHRGKGYGQEAMNLLLHQARQRGYQKCKLDVLETESQAASHVYQKAGFSVVKRTTFKTKNDVVWMERDLL